MKDWPSCVADYGDVFRANLDRIVYNTRIQAEQQANSYTNSEFAAQAKVIVLKAIELHNLVQAFHDKDNGRNFLSAEQKRDCLDYLVNQLESDGSTLPDGDRELIAAGMRQETVQYPLLGLIGYSRALQDRFSGKDSRNSTIAFNAVKDVVKLCGRIGIPTDRRGSASTKYIVHTMFEKVNAGLPSDAQLKPLADRDLSRIRTKFAEVGDNMEFWNWNP